MENNTAATNPYDEGNRIKTPLSTSPRELPDSELRERPRSRTVQSARDASRRYTAENKEREEQEAHPNRSKRRKPRKQPIRRRKKMGIGVVVAAIIGAIIVLLALLYWINRPVPVTINGEPAEVRIGSSLQDVAHEEHLGINPGNYVTVSGNVIRANQGYAFNAKVNGKQFTHDEIEEYRIEGTESIEFTDGDDIIEEYNSKTERLEPYLRMEGSGYSLQYVSQWARMGEKQYRTGKVSGETAEVVTVEPQDCIITCRDLFIEGDTKYVALTFDDGPSDVNTPQYLDILDRYGVKATFYNLGENTQTYQNIAREVLARGHQLCNHTMAHNQLTAVDNDTIRREIATSAEVIQNVTGLATTHLRPPYGDFTERSWLASGGTITASVRWTGDSQDWRYTGMTDSETITTIVNNSLLNIHSGSIILMHDGGGGGAQDVAALPKIIERLQAEGYKFVTISDLMRAAGDIPEEVCSGTGTMPQGNVWPSEIHPDDIAAAAKASAASSATTTTSETTSSSSDDSTGSTTSTYDTDDDATYYDDSYYDDTYATDADYL
ncbi:MAG: polysaccharide deacetylase family protein [Atopobiaceae bacterium]|nr:polysaccharide deacetylase family protein [Atopobiaceae bacterium]